MGLCSKICLSKCRHTTAIVYLYFNLHFGVHLAYINLPEFREINDVKVKLKYMNLKERKFNLSLRSRKILEHFSDYTGLAESQVLEETLPFLLEDEDFIHYVEDKRSNKRLKQELGLFDDKD